MPGKHLAVMALRVQVEVEKLWISQWKSDSTRD